MDAAFFFWCWRQMGREANSFLVHPRTSMKSLSANRFYIIHNANINKCKQQHSNNQQETRTYR
eukprot:m.121267 g.121267  ORF g.121267 m.121267 type:complete len:63 (+) comp12920_c6_seq11:1501-1689(+)